MKDNKNDKLDKRVREIEFRAKDITDKWQYGSLIKEEYLDCDMNSKNLGKFVSYYFIRTRDDKDWTAHYGSIPVKVETIGQFTGLCDKNGKKIYEGDVVRVFSDCDGYYIEKEYIYGVVVYEDEFGFGYEISFNHIRYSCDEYLGNHRDDIEVVGNVWDNPELLGGSDEECDN